MFLFRNDTFFYQLLQLSVNPISEASVHDVAFPYINGDNQLAVVQKLVSLKKSVHHKCKAGDLLWK